MPRTVCMPKEQERNRPFLSRRFDAHEARPAAGRSTEDRQAGGRGLREPKPFLHQRTKLSLHELHPLVRRIQCNWTHLAYLHTDTSSPFPSTLTIAKSHRCRREFADGTFSINRAGLLQIYFVIQNYQRMALLGNVPSGPDT